jgi:hypothetical protein
MRSMEDPDKRMSIGNGNGCFAAITINEGTECHKVGALTPFGRTITARRMAI